MPVGLRGACSGDASLNARARVSDRFWPQTDANEASAARSGQSQLSVFASLFRHTSDGLAQLTNEWRQTMAKNVICLWYDGTAEEAARFYAQTFPDSAVTAVHRAPGDYPDGKQGQVLTVEFTVVGVPCLGLNGGPAFKHSEAFSFQIVTEDQAETDRYWNAIVGNGGAESACGWCKDKWGLSWQITPRVLLEATTDSDRAAAKRAFDAMMKMKKIDIATIEAARRGPARA
jgi:predicted 3-demethylubiquinone-9 3-methyltransferase (glyoxalase superfamily)